MGGRKDLASKRQLSMIEETDYLEEGQGHFDRTERGHFQNAQRHNEITHRFPITTVEEADNNNSPLQSFDHGNWTGKNSQLIPCGFDSDYDTGRGFHLNQHNVTKDESENPLESYIDKSVNDNDNVLNNARFYSDEKSNPTGSITNERQKNNYDDNYVCSNNSTSEINDGFEVSKSTRSIRSDKSIENIHNSFINNNRLDILQQTNKKFEYNNMNVGHGINNANDNDDNNNKNNNIHEMFQVLIKSIDGTSKDKAQPIMEIEDVTKIKSLLYQTDDRIEKQPIALNDIISSFKEKFSMPNAKRMVPVRQRSRRNLEPERTISSESERDNVDASTSNNNRIISTGSLDSQMDNVRSNCRESGEKERNRTSSLEEETRYGNKERIRKIGICLDKDLEVSRNEVSVSSGRAEMDERDRVMEDFNGTDVNKNHDLNFNGDEEKLNKDLVKEVYRGGTIDGESEGVEKFCRGRTHLAIEININKYNDEKEIAAEESFDLNCEYKSENNDCNLDIPPPLDKKELNYCEDKEETLTQKRKSYWDKGRQKYIELDTTQNQHSNNEELFNARSKIGDTNIEKIFENENKQNTVLTDRNSPEQRRVDGNEQREENRLPVCSIIVPEIRREGPKYYDDDNYDNDTNKNSNDDYNDHNNEISDGCCEGRNLIVTTKNSENIPVETNGKPRKNKNNLLYPNTIAATSNPPQTTSLLTVPEIHSEKAPSPPSSLTNSSSNQAKHAKESTIKTKPKLAHKTFLSVPQADNTNAVVKPSSNFLNPNGSIAKPPMLRHVSQPNLTAHQQPQINNLNPTNPNNDSGSPVSKFQNEDLNSDLAKLKATALRLNLITRRPSYLKWLEDRKTNWPPAGTMPLGNASRIVLENTSITPTKTSAASKSTLDVTVGVSDFVSKKNSTTEKLQYSKSPKRAENETNESQSKSDDSDDDNGDDTLDVRDNNRHLDFESGGNKTRRFIIGGKLGALRKAKMEDGQKEESDVRRREVSKLVDGNGRGHGVRDNGEDDVLSRMRTVMALYPRRRFRCNDVDKDRLTPDRKMRIEKSLEWLQMELKNMRNQDQQLARQLLALRQEIHTLKYSMSYQEHRDHMEDVQCDLEDLQEFSNVLDLPSTLYLDTPLKNIGVTKWNITARRFSTC